jgi:hypothetical protein
MVVVPVLAGEAEKNVARLRLFEPSFPQLL